MKKRPLGKTGFTVSEISLGTVEIGMSYGISSEGKPDERSSEQLLHRALDLGINLIDTARAYGESEAIIGRALGNRRKEYVLASKVLSFHDGNLTPPERREAITQSVHTSLRSLQTDAIDIMLLHTAPVEVIRDGEAAGVLQELKAAGQIRATGASVYDPEAALLAIESGDFDCLQIAYSALDRRPEEEIFAKAKEAGVGLIARSVLLKGALTHRYALLPDSLASLKNAVVELEKIASDADEVESLPEMAYRYVLSQCPPETALLGTSNLAELETTISYASRGPLRDETINKLRQRALLGTRELNPGLWPSV